MNALDFTQTTSLSAEGKDVKYLGINGNLAWSKVDGSGILSTYMSETAYQISQVNMFQNYGYGEYICPNGVVYNYMYNNSQYKVPGYFAGADTGNKRPFAVSPYLMATAAHYGDTIQLGSLVVGSATVNRVAHENLAEWAKASGKWTNEYIDSLNIGDIEMVKLGKDSGDPIPSVICPYFVDSLKLQALIGKSSLAGIPGWNCPKQTFQDYEGDNSPMSQPIVFAGRTSNNLMRWSTAGILSSLIPDGTFIDYDDQQKTWKEGITAIPNSYLGTTGDSGRPVYLYIGNNPQSGGVRFNVVISHCQAVEVPSFGPTPPYFMTGPDYTLAYPILKEYVKEYEGTDALKTITI